MPNEERLYSDHEYNILSEIDDNEKISQRELSKKLGVSVSTVNVLMNKMMREGLIKMTQVSGKQVLYMLTPVGMMEKAKKTVSYLKAHYRAFYETKEKIKGLLKELSETYDTIYVMIPEDELGEMFEIAVEEYRQVYSKENVLCIKSFRDVYKSKKNIVVLMLHVDDKMHFENELGSGIKVVDMNKIL